MPYSQKEERIHAWKTLHRIRSRSSRFPINVLQNGGKFLSGFASGFMSSAFALGRNVLGQSAIIARTAISAIIGGVSSMLAGGKFLSGAVSAAFVHLFNNERAEFTLRHSKPYYEEDTRILQIKALAISKMSYKEVLIAQEKERLYGQISVVLGTSAISFTALVSRYGYTAAIEIIAVAIVETTEISGAGKAAKFRQLPRIQQLLRERTRHAIDSMNRIKK
jgi:hypothetical protein